MVGSHIVVEKGGIFWKEGVDYGSVAYSYQKRGYLFWEGGVDSGRVAYRCLKGESYIQRRRGRFWEGRKDVKKGGGIFWEEGVDYGSVAYSYQKRGYLFWEGGVDSGRVAYRCLKGESYIQRRRGRFWEGRKDV